MKGRIGLSVGLLCIVSAAHLVAYGADAPPGGKIFSIDETRADGWTVSVRPSAFPATYLTVDGGTHILFSRQPASTDERTGWPKLPYEVLSLGIPPGTFVSAQLVDEEYETYENQEVAPVPSYTFDEKNEAIATYKKDPAAYRLNQFLPSNIVLVDSPFTLRSQRIVTIRVAPYQYNPALRTMKRLVKGRLEVQLKAIEDGAMAQPSFSAVGDPHFEGVYKALMSNYDQARSWRTLARSTARTMVDSSRGWFEAGPTYYRIGVSDDGWYRITSADLQSVGTSISQIDTSRLRLYHRGNLVPVYLRPDSSVEFFGQRKYGDSTYLDFFTDTSAYWLTWDGTGGGPKYRDIPSPAPGGGQTVTSSTVSRHFEENTDYYEGTGLVQVTENDPVPGEGWAWEYYFPNTTIDHSFEIDRVDTAGGSMAELRVRLFSTTLHYNDPDHIARFWLNDSLLGEIGFTGREGVTFEQDVPLSLLRDGNNVLRIMSVPTASMPNQFYLDWFEIDYLRLHRAAGDQLLVNLDSTGSMVPVSIYADGFTSPGIEVFDRLGGRRILGGVVTGDSVSGYGITFSD
ncbi:MAG: hypothetical protein KAJ12_01325, partial [Bacteroidetes bacterium]|nr:hypothetical protein [Bacteroidota bacterium]